MVMESAASPQISSDQRCCIGGKPREGDAQQYREGGGLGSGGHQAHDRRGRSLVDIRRPHMEGRGGDLEAKADQHHGQRQEGHARRRAVASPAAMAAMAVEPVAPKASAMP